ncbi:tyrosine-protein phosphatase [Rhodococcus spelaei]|uniref:Tyrosine-protein phosphatase n=1 Tax=Rhodococcus spelaei TaxID=2546320 RepID=A0A541B285_9NOCA|nr:tyrosine-protein phosphatase [Rhodococcus spelaei]TQF66440.1 tyrosine-protein phosphatase [Rhodococcus spelaei]
MSRHGSTFACALVVSGAALLSGVGGALAQAEPSNPPAVTALLDAGSAGLGSSAPAADAPRLASIDNFRDVAGTGAGYAAGWTHVNKGVFYRANAIVPNEADMATLAGLKLSTVYDLRTDDEVAQKQDVLPSGVTYKRIPILSGNINAMLGKIKSPDDARKMMQDMNRSFATGDVEKAKFRELLTDLATTDGGQVFHCTAGKDRTGWASAVLLSIAGVSNQTIMDDYLLTNEYAKDSIAKNTEGLKRAFGDAYVNFLPLVTVEQSFLQAGLDQVATTYGSMDKYLTEGLGLSPATIGKLKAKLVG